VKTVLAHGVFDLLHVGHMAHLQRCRDLGDFLYVSVVADKSVKKGRPLVYSEKDRLFALSCLECVDELVLCEAAGPWNILRELKPTIYARSEEYAAKTQPEYAVCKELGIKTAFVPSRPPHTMDLIKQIKKL